MPTTHTKQTRPHPRKAAAPKRVRKPAPSAKPLHPALTPDRIAELRSLAKKIDREEKDEIINWGNKVMDRYEQMASILPALRAEREAQGLSLADMALKVGVGRERLSRLENNKGVNPTLRTLFRYAEALGKRVEIKLV